jgi:hypothetical protein
MKKIISFIFALLLVFNFVLAQNYPYLSIKKVPRGLMLGVEVLNQKTNLSLKPEGYSYEWTFPDISLTSIKTFNNIFFLNLDKFFDVLFLNLKISQPLTQEIYNFKNNKLILPLPQIKIVRQQDSLLLPLVSQLNKENSLRVITKNFSSQNLNYLWEFNGFFISNEKELTVSKLTEKSGTIKVKVSGSFPWERAEDLVKIQIE